MSLHRVKNKAKLDEGVQILKEYEDAYTANKETASRVSKAKTKVKNFFKAFTVSEQIAATAAIEIDGISYTYKASESDILDPRKFYKMWQDGEITEDQYFSAISVGKEEAKNALGEDQCLAIQVHVIGKTADVRRDDKQEGMAKGVFVRLPEVAKPGIVKRTIPKPALQVPAKKPVPRVLVLRRP